MNHIKYKDIELEFDDNVEVVICDDKLTIRSKNQNLNYYYYPIYHPMQPNINPSYPQITYISSKTD